MMSELEVRNWKIREFERIPSIVDPLERSIALVVVSTLDGVLDD